MFLKRINDSDIRESFRVSSILFKNQQEDQYLKEVVDLDELEPKQIAQSFYS